MTTRTLAAALVLLQAPALITDAAAAPKWRYVWHIGGSGREAPLNVGAIGPQSRSKPPVKTWGDFNSRFVRPARVHAELHNESLRHYVWEPFGIPGFEPGTGKSRLLFGRMEAEALGLAYLTEGWQEVFDECRDRGEQLIVHIGCPPARHRNPDETPRWEHELAQGPEEFLSLYAREFGGLLEHCDGACLDNGSSETRFGDPSRRFVFDTQRILGKQPWTEATCRLDDPDLIGLPCMVAWQTFQRRHLPERSPEQEGVYPLAGTRGFDECYSEVLVPLYDNDVPFTEHQGRRKRVSGRYTPEFMQALARFSRSVSRHGVTVGISHMQFEGLIQQGMKPSDFYVEQDE